MLLTRMPAGSVPRWDEPSPLPRGPWVPNYCVTYGQEHRFVIVCRRVCAIHVHYVPSVVRGQKGRTQPCTSRGDDCWCDHSRFGGGRWAGWLAVQPWGTDQLRLVQLTPKAVQCDSRFEDGMTDLRGLCLTLSRVTNKVNGEMKAKIGGHAELKKELPDEPPMRAVVLQLYLGADRGEKGTPFNSLGGMGTLFRNLKTEGR